MDPDVGIFILRAIVVLWLIGCVWVVWLLLRWLRRRVEHSQRAPRVQPMQVSCPACGAQPGYWCATAPNTPHHFHAERRNEARSLTWLIRTDVRYRSHLPPGN